MNHVTLNNKLEMPQLGFGVWQVDNDQAAAAVTTALNTGYTSIDTAMIYKNEEGVGQALKETSVPREDLFITTKVWNADQGYDNTLRAFDESLERLGLDYVDLYLIHWPLPERRLFISAWEKLIDARSAGLARSIGVANFLPQHLDLIQDETGTNPSVNQFELHPTHQVEEIINHCTDNRIAVEAYAPLGNATDLGHPTITRIAEETGSTPAQVILAWHMARGFIAIPKSGTPERIHQNLAAARIRLPSWALEEIDGMHTGTDKVWGDPLDVN